MGAALVVGAHAAGVFGAEERYPLRVEYEIAKACVDGSNARLPHDSYLAKQEQCLCTLEAVMKKISYEKYKQSTTEFAATFRKVAPACIGKGRS